MLEDLAYAYVQSSETTSNAIRYALLLVGGLIGGATSRSQNELQRVPYFALSAMILAGVATVTRIEAEFLVTAMENGILWTVLAVDFAVLMAAGFAYGRISAARSRHAFGHGRMAFLAFIPVANLWLLFKPRPRDWPAAGDEQPLSGGAGVIVGLVMLVAAQMLNSAAVASVERDLTRAAETADPNRMLLPDLIQTLAKNEPVPRKIDEIYTLTAVEAGEATLAYIYMVNVEDRSVPEDFRSRVIKVTCAKALLRRVMELGGTVTMAYRAPDGEELLRVDMAAGTCPA